MDLIALVRHVCEVQVEVADVWQANVGGVEERREACVLDGADIDSDFVVQAADGDIAELLGSEAQAFEVGGTIDL